MQLSNRTYDILKWIDLVCLPAIGTAWAGLAQIWNLPYPDEIPATIMVLCTLLGALLGISSATYYKGVNASIEMPEDEQEVDNNEEGMG